MFTVTITLRSGADLAQVEQIVADELARLTRENLSDKEIARVVAAQESSAIYRLEGLNSRANVLQEYNQFLGDPGKITFDLDRYRKTTAEKIRATALRCLMPAHMITVVTNPAKGGGK